MHTEILEMKVAEFVFEHCDLWNVIQGANVIREQIISTLIVNFEIGDVTAVCCALIGSSSDCFEEL